MLCRVQSASCWLSHSILFFLMPVVLSHQFNLGTLRSRRMRLSLPDVFKDALQIERVKGNILQSLNISKPPFITPRTLPSSRIRIPKEGDPSDHHDTLERMPNVSLILSEATNPYRKDTLVFNIHSKIRARLSQIDNPLIILRLRLNSKRSSASRSSASAEKKASKRRKSDESICSKNTSETVTTDNSDANKKSRSEEKGCINKSKRRRSKNSLRSRRRKQRKQRKLRRKRSRKIRIVVRVIDSITNKRRRIFVEKLVLKRSKTFTVPVPKTLFKEAAETPSHTLTVQVVCRNCKRFVKMDRVYRKGKKQTNSRNSLRLNPNRPYLYIKTSARSRNNIAKGRSKRHLPSNACVDNSKYIYSDSKVKCCEKLTYISFEKLGLGDVIVHPQGFNTVDCIGVCEKKNSLILDKIGSSFSRQSEDSLTSVGSSVPQCIPTVKSHLDVLYFADSNTIIPGRLVNLVGESCGCAAA